MPDLSVTLFGSPQVKRGNEQISIQRRKDLALLIYLVCTSKPQSRDTLATLLWQDQTQADARSNLRKSLSRLKSVLGDGALFAAQDQAALNPKLSIHLDTADFHSHVNRFHNHLKKGIHPHLCEECQSILEDAARLYCADFLQGFSLPDSPVFEEWQFFQAESLRKDLAQVLEHLVLQHTSAGNYTKAIEYCRRWLALDRLNESPHRQLMLLYALSGQHAAALRQFDECARLLREELHTEMEEETIRLHEAIQKKQLHEVLDLPGSARRRASRALPQPSDTPIHNLPVYPDPFIGRSRELTEISAILQDPSCRVLTLLGPGGSGKTRLALQSASLISSDPHSSYKDGAGFIPLAPVADPASMVGAMMEGLRISGPVKGADARQQLLAHIHGRSMLFVIDNFEHLLGSESTQLVADILDAAPQSKILITSRERLNIRGEYLFLVEGLETPGDESQLPQLTADSVLPAFSALQLFEQCAARIQPSFKITRENYIPITQICRKVQGMPLAIELAASWLEVFSPEDINEEIQRSLDFLQSNWRDLPDRQRSLRAIFDSSWELLDRQTRTIVKALSVFRTSFTREAAQSVSGASAKALLNLTNKSWIQKLSDGRYQIHELLKQFVYEKLSREPSTLEQVRNRYCEYYLGFAHALWESMKGLDQRWAYAGTESEYENIRTAWAWLVSSDRCESLVHDMLPVLLHYAEIRGKNSELVGMLEAVIGAKTLSGKARNQPAVEIILRAAKGTFFQDNYPVRYSIHDALFPIDTKSIQQAWNQATKLMELHELGFWGILLAFIYGRLINLKEGVRQIKEMIPHFRAEEQAWELATAYFHLLKLIIPNRADPHSQIQTLNGYLSQAMNIFDQLGDRINAGHIFWHWGELKYMQRDFKGAIEEWNSARAAFLSVDEWGSATTVLWNLADAYQQLGDFPTAFDCCREMANIYMQHGLHPLVVGPLSRESYEKSRYGDLAEAIQIRQQCINIIEEIGPDYQVAWNCWEMGELVRLSGDLTAATDWFERSGKIFNREQDNVGKSFYFRGLADIALTREEFESARLHFAESVRLSRAAKHTWMVIYALTGLGRSEIGLRTLALAEKHIQQALKLASKSRDQGIILVVLAAYAELMKQKGQSEAAVQSACLVCSHFATWNETRNRTAGLLANLRKSMLRSTFSQAETKGKETDVWELIEGLVSQHKRR